MGLSQILIFAALILAYRLAMGSRWRGWVLFILSALAIFWLQPATQIRNLGYWLPLTTLGLAVFGWVVTHSKEERASRENWIAAALLAGSALLISLAPYINLDPHFAGGSLPSPAQALIGLVLIGGIGLLLARFSRPAAGVLTAALALLILLFILLKVPALTEQTSAVLRAWSEQAVVRASALDIRWLGFSYVAFRLIATLRDRQAGRLPSMNLREYVAYLIFFPAFTAGPIDRPERFLKDLRAERPFDNADALAGGQRLVMGIFKKFALADSLAYFSLGANNALQIQTSAWMWVALIAYSLRIYLDFGGYTDIAIGLARWLGIHLPENFRRPYLQPNLAQFWNNWHMTLTQWFRAYYFNPITRSLRSSKVGFPAAWIILFTQVTTMVLIGFWHGGTWNFILWGLWHGVGLFIQNRYSEAVRAKLALLGQRPILGRAYTLLATLVTFVYVSLGWAWFVLPEPEQSLRVLGRLVGLR